MFAVDNDVKFTKLETLGQIAVSDSRAWAPLPRADVSEKCGASLVAQLLESIIYRTRCFGQVSDEFISKIYTEACCTDDIRLGRSCDLPSLKSLLKAVLDRQAVLNSEVIWTKDLETLSHFNEVWGVSIVELKLTTATMNAHKHLISDVGELVSEDYTKGFLLIGTSEESCLLQNSLGTDCGACGFNIVPTPVFEKLFVKGATLALKTPEESEEADGQAD